MYIKRVTLADFGRLRGTIEFAPDRCNIICQDNEYGKTTIMDAVLYTLYNFPTTGFARDVMRPKERYRPWNAPARAQNVYVVELEICDIAGRNYILRADFNRQQPFTLHDRETRQPIPLDGISFGQRYLRMALPGFTQCFFLRQDEKEGGQRGQLVSVIEEAAASNRQDTPTSVSGAIEKLASPVLSDARIDAEDLKVATILRRLEARKAELKAEMATLERNLQARATEIEASDRLNDRVEELSDTVTLLEYSLAAVRRHEKQNLLSRWQESLDARGERERQLAELAPYADIQLTRRQEVVSLLSDYKSARQRHEEHLKAQEAAFGPELEKLNTELAALPQAIARLAPEDLSTVRDLAVTLTDREEQLARESEKLSAMETQLREQGVPIDRLEELHQTHGNLTQTDREILFEHTEAHNEAQAALTAIESGSLTAREQAMQAKARRSWYSNLGLGLAGLVIAFLVVGIVLLLADTRFYAWVCIVLAGVIGVFSSLVISTMRARVTAEELEPALKSEMELSAQAKQIRDQLETLEIEYHETLQRLGLTHEQVEEVRDVEHWKQSAAPWVAGRDLLDRVQTDLADARARGWTLVQDIAEADSADSLTGAALRTAASQIEKYFDLQEERNELTSKNERLQTESQTLLADLQSKQQALETVITCPLTAEVADTEPRAQAWLDACDKALQLQTLKQEFGAVHKMTDDEVAHLQSDIAELESTCNTILAAAPALTDTVIDYSIRSEAIERQLAESRAERERLREQLSRGFREAEQAVHEWRTRGPVVQQDLADIEDSLTRANEFAEACQVAHQQLSEISAQVYTQWATALNERVNRVVPLINDRYRDVACSPELDISVYSAEAGRRLETREIQHLSKGARDQLLLAVRIAIAEYLTAHVGNLPLALDEPFAHWDDERFIEGMRFLDRLSPTHQVILLSCHRWRYEHLQATNPELANRLHFCELQPLAD